MRPRSGAFRPDPLTATLLAAVALALFATVRFPPDVVRGRTVAPAAVASAPPAHVQDFAYVFNYARWAAGRPGTSPYSYDAHRRFLLAWLGPKVGSALCFAYSPVMVALLAPLFWLPTAWAWLIWNLAGVGLASAAVWRLSDGRAAVRRWALLTIMGVTTFHCLANGQTALVTLGCFAALLHTSRDGDDGAPARRTLACTACVVVLSAKPPLAVVAIVTLLAAGHAAAVVSAIAAVGAAVVAAAIYWTPAMLWDYATLVGRYNLTDADEIVRAGFAPLTMTNLRAVLLRVGLLDDSQAFFASAWILAALLIVPLVAVAARRRPWPLEVAACWTVSAYLLFAPHLSSTEDVLLLVPLALLLRSDAVCSKWGRACVVAGCVLPQWLNSSSLVVASPAIGAAWEPIVPALDFALKLAPALIVARIAAARPWLIPGRPESTAAAGGVRA